MTDEPTLWDVAVVGAGPAGATAARVAAELGARVILLERATLPRYKTCGGGIIGFSRSSLPPGVDIPFAQHIDAVTFTHNGRLRRTRRDRHGRLLSLVNRAEFDEALTRAATARGVTLREGVTVTSIDQPSEEHVVLTAADGTTIQARIVIGADGSASRVARYVGVTFAQVDLGLEAEIEVPPAVQERWRGLVEIDWGPLPGSYGWVFPKGDTLTVGVIGARGEGEALRHYYRALLDRHGLSDYPRAHDSGHLTRCRDETSPLAKGRVLVVGDAAGLLEPWTREGISYALRSGALAGRAAVTENPAETYEQAIKVSLGPEMARGARKLDIYERHSWLVHVAISVLPAAWRRFAEFCRGPRTEDREPQTDMRSAEGTES